MSITVDDTTLVRCVALTADPAFIDMTGTITGTIGDTYNPTFMGERGFMAHVDADPLDIGVELTGDKLAICFKHTPAEIDEALALHVWPISATVSSDECPPCPPQPAGKRYAPKVSPRRTAREAEENMFD